ncbi:MAG: electron transfer flavoprotein subunit beta/FixA family protein [Elusimicrobia bacterium]|nr:electron transfer flavoprotein subunit beta/FixA family protein [Elusimicrobiota bacterium]
MIGDKLHIVVCIKQTSSSTNAQFDAKKATVQAAGAQAAINPFDEYAIEEGVRIRERLNSKATVHALSLGPAEAESSLREAIAKGCDGATLLSDPQFEGSDTAATAYLLQKGIEKLGKLKGPVDLVLCGKQTNDSDAGVVGTQVAAWWDVPSAASVRKVVEIAPGNPGKVVVGRMMEDGTDTLEMSLPAVLSIVKEINEPRIASLKGKMASRKAEIAVWRLSDLEAEVEKIGAAGSALRMGETYPPPKRSGGEVIEGKSPQEKAKKLLQKLKETKLL